MRKAKQSTAKNVMVLMVDSTDHVTGKTGLTLTITASKDGAAFASISPAVTERGSGWYNVALTTAHTDTLGDLALHITAAAADPADMVLLVEAGATDADVSTRLATAGYTSPDNASIAAIKAKTDNLPASPAATGDAMTLTAAAVDAILDEVIEGAYTLRQILRGYNSALMAKLSGAEVNSPAFRDLADSKNRITATTDASGNRTAVTLDLT